MNLIKQSHLSEFFFFLVILANDSAVLILRCDILIALFEIVELKIVEIFRVALVLLDT